MNKPIDTSTTAGKIAVMQEFERGHKVQFKKSWMEKYEDAAEPTWDWSAGDYRLKPREPREFAIAIPLDGRTPHVVPADGGVYSRHAYAFIKVREVLE